MKEQQHTVVTSHSESERAERYHLYVWACKSSRSVAI
jgi:hypothetical protein